MQHSETILRADAALTPAGPISDAEVAFDADGRITYVGSVRPGREVTHELSGHVLMPGLVNGHTHSAMTLQRGVADDDGFMPWLNAVQAREQHLTRDDIAAGLQLALVEMIETGTTAFADMYFWDADLIELVVSSGMRVLAAPATFTAETVGFPAASNLNGAEVTELTERLAQQFAGHPQVRLAFGPHAPYTSPAEFLTDITARARRTGLPIHTHVAESRAETAQMLERYGKTSADYLKSIGLFDASVLAAHCVHLTPGEIESLVDAQVAMSHNPVSNLKLGNGVAPLPELIIAGARVCLGTDGVASNNTLDLFEEIKLATILHRGTRQDALAVRASEVLDIATRGGAEAIGFADTGVLRVGALADIIALDVNTAGGTQFVADALVSHLAFVATGADVREVFIGGQHVYARGQHLSLDADAVKERARAATARLRHAAGV